MRKKLLFLPLLLLSAMIGAQTASVEVLIKMTLSPNSGIDPSEMQITDFSGTIEREFAWDAGQNAFVGAALLEPENVYTYTIAANENSWRYAGRLITPGEMTEATTTIENTTDLSGWYAVSFKPSDAGCTLIINEVYNEDHRLFAEVSGQRKTYLTTGTYHTMPQAHKDNAPIWMSEVEFTVTDSQMEVVVDIDFDKLKLITFEIEDILGTPLPEGYVKLFDAAHSVKSQVENGAAQIYAPAGAYHYQVDALSKYWNEMAIKQLVVENSPVNTRFSYIDEGWVPLKIEVSGNEIQAFMVTLNNTGEISNSYFGNSDTDEAPANTLVHELYTPGKEYSYLITIMGEGKQYDCLSGKVNAATTNELLLNVESAGYTEVSPTYKNLPEGIDQASLTATIYNDNIKVIVPYGIKAMLFPDNYRCVVNDSKNKLLATKEFSIEDEESSKELVIDFAEQKLYDVTISLANIPSSIDNRNMIWYISENNKSYDISALGSLQVNTSQPAFLQIPAGDYRFILRARGYWIDSGVEICAEVTENKEIVLDFNEYACIELTVNTPADAKTNTCHLLKNNNLIKIFELNGLSHRTLYVLPDEYEITVSAFQGNAFHTAETKPLSLSAGNTTQCLINFDSDPGIMVATHVVDNKGWGVKQPIKMTLNGNEYIVKKTALMTHVKEDYIDYKIEAEG